VPQPPNLTKAELREIKWDAQQQVQLLEKRVPVQFNPQTLKVTFSNQKVGGDQSGGSAIQYVGRGTTKLSMELWFDVTVPLPKGSIDPQGDVRRLTKEVAYFIRPKEQSDADKFIPPGVRVIWGTFLFDGVMDSLDETLEFFSEDGKPLRARVAISISQQEIQFQFGRQGPTGSGAMGSPGTQPQQQARAGDTVQQMAARQGQHSNWKQLAAANDIENPRQLSPGTLLNMNPRR
jgi:hypothetical protein